MNNLKQKIQQIKEEGYNLQPFEVMKEAVQYYQKTFFLAATTLLLALLLFSFIGSYLLLNSGLLEVTTDQEAMQEQLVSILEQLTEPPLIFYYLGTTVIINGLIAVLLGGYYKINAEAATGKTPRFVSVFKYFFSLKGLYIFIVQIVVSLICTIISTLLKEVGLETAALIINWLINIITVFATPLIIFGKMSPFEALKTSIDVVNKQPIPIMLTLILNYFLASAGLFLFVIGILFTLPYLFSIFFTLYKQIIGYNLEEEDSLNYTTKNQH